MKLLIFAHRGEAKAFFSSDNLSHDKNSPLTDLYYGESYYLLMTGEGHENAMNKTSIALTYLKQQSIEIKQVINLGICGSINPNNDDLNQIIPIRTLYSFRGKQDFKSFTCANLENSNASRMDLITVEDRVLKKEKVNDLLPIANLVDREAWAIAYSVFSFFKIPFFCIKLVSDNVHFEDEFCKNIKENAENYSIQLYQYYIEIFNLPDTNKEEEDLPLELKDFYFTQAQKNLFFALKEKLQLTYLEMITQFDIPNISKSKKLPKEKTKDLITKMQKALSPISYQLKEDLEAKIKPFQSNHLSFQFDRSLESDKIKGHFNFSDSKERDDIILSLQNFPIDSVKAIFDGQISKEEDTNV